jgi:ATP-dependent DNA helicase RecQ
LLRHGASLQRPARRLPLAPAGPPGTTAGAASLFDALRVWRAAQAKAQSVPPYVIFHDAVLREIAAVRPLSLEEMGQIRGVGSSKLQRYGAELLAVLMRS